MYWERLAGSTGGAWACASCTGTGFSLVDCSTIHFASWFGSRGRLPLPMVIQVFYFNPFLIPPCRRVFSAVSVGVKVLLSGNAGLFPAAHFIVFDLVHTVYNIMRDLGFQFENVMTEQPQFFNRD